MANDNLFAPPTPEEMALFAPPSPEEMARFASPPTQEAPAASPETQVEAGIESFGQIPTAGYLPQLQGGVAALGQQAMSGLGKLGIGPEAEVERMKAEGLITEEGTEFPEQYLKARDQALRRSERLGEEAPVASAIGTGLGLASSLAIPGGAAAKGASAGKAALQGAALGGAYNPGDVEGTIDPVQAGERLKGAALGGATGGAAGGVAKFLRKGGDISKMVGRVKQSEGLSKEVKKEIDLALKNLTTTQIAPKSKELQKLLKGKQVEINPERLRGISPALDRMADKLAAKIGPNQRATIPATQAQRLKKVLDKHAKHLKSQPFQEGAQAKIQRAKIPADIMRGKVAGVDPRVGKLNKEMAEAIKFRDALSRSSKTRPIASITAKPGTDKGSMLAGIDKMSGSKLGDRGDVIASAKELLLDNPALAFATPFKGMQSFAKLGARAGMFGARGAAPVAEKLSTPSLTAILEGTRGTGR